MKIRLFRNIATEMNRFWYIFYKIWTFCVCVYVYDARTFQVSHYVDIRFFGISPNVHWGHLRVWVKGNKIQFCFSDIEQNLHSFADLSQKLTSKSIEIVVRFNRLKAFKFEFVEHGLQAFHSIALWLINGIVQFFFPQIRRTQFNQIVHVLVVPLNILCDFSAQFVAFERYHRIWLIVTVANFQECFE